MELVIKIRQKKVMILSSLHKHSYLKLFNTQLYLNVKKIENLKYSKISCYAILYEFNLLNIVNFYELY